MLTLGFLLIIVFFSSASGQSPPMCPGNSITILDKVTGKHECVSCRTCPPGEGLTVNCGDVITPQTPYACEPCVLGKTFSSGNEPGACKDCENCGKYRETKKACTLTSKAECGNCNIGAYPEGLLGMCVPCSPCCDDGNDIVIPGCKVLGVPSNMQCSYARSEKCGKLAAKVIIKASITRATTLQIRSSTTPTKLYSKTTTEITPQGKRSNHDKEIQFGEKQEIKDSTNDAALSKSEIAGIVTGVSLSVAVIIALSVWWYIKRRNKQASEERTERVPTNDKRETDNQPVQVLGEESGDETEELNQTVVQREAESAMPVQETEESPPPFGVQDSQPPGCRDKTEFIQSGSCEEPRPSPAKEGHRHTKVVVNETSVEFITVRVKDYDAEPVKV